MMMQKRGEQCPSDLRLDELLTDELAGGERAETLGHLDGCRVCRDRRHELERDRDAFRAVRPALRRPRRAGRWIGASAALAVAAAVVALVAPRDRAEPDGTRTKGPPRWSFHVQGSGHARVGGPGEQVRPGDTLTYEVTVWRRTYLAILSRDAAGRATVYYPGGDSAEPVGPGRQLDLPLATVLDGTLGPERLHGLFCDRPVALEPLRRALAASGELSVPSGCTLQTVAIEKVP
jgi:hypothetical protein